jgi:hypothetical protein
MAISFPMYDMNLGSSLVEGLQAGQAFKQSREMFPYMKQQQEEAAKQAQYLSQMQAARTPYAGGLAQAELAKAQADPLYTMAQTRKTEEVDIPKGKEEIAWYGPQAQSEINQRRAAAAHMGAEDRFLPLKYALEAQKTQQSASRFGQAYQMVQMVKQMNPAEKSQWLKQNQEAYNQAMADTGNKQLQNEASKYQSLVDKLLSNTYGGGFQNSGNAGSSLVNNLSAGPKAQQPTQALAQPQVQPVANQQPQAPQQPPMQQQQPAAGNQGKPQFTNKPEDIQTLKDINSYYVNRELLSGKQKQRLDGALDMERWLSENRDEYAPKLKDATQYAGLIGKGKRERDEWLNKNPDAIANYDWAVSQFAPNLVNQIKVMEQLASSNEQRHEMHAMVQDINNARSNPQRAIASMNNAVKTLYQLGDAIIKTSEPINKGVTRRIHELPKDTGQYIDTGTATQQKAGQQAPAVNRSMAPPSQADLEHTAKLHNLTVEQVKQKLGIQ